jgi:hypothetical protein
MSQIVDKVQLLFSRAKREILLLRGVGETQIPRRLRSSE